MPRGIRYQSGRKAVVGQAEVTIAFGPITAEDGIAAAHWMQDYNPTYLFPDGTGRKDALPLPLHPVLVSGLVDAALRHLARGAVVKRLRIEYGATPRIGDRLKAEAALQRHDGEDASGWVQVSVFRGNRVMVAKAQAWISLPS